MKYYPYHNAATHTVAFLIGFCTLSSYAFADDLICGGQQSVSYIGDLVQDFTIPTVDPPQFLRLRAEGADGGDARAGTNKHCESLGGSGAKATALFSVGFGDGQLKPGGRIRFIIGDSGETDNGSPAQASQGAGGGGSAVLYLPPGGDDTIFGWIRLVVGGGGGGAHQGVLTKVCVDGHDGDDGRTEPDCGSDGNGTHGGDGGCGGDAGVSKQKNSLPVSGGGGGWNQSASLNAGGWSGSTSGGDGGEGDQVGGWGFGGGGGADTSGGGGGGYSGGGGGWLFNSGGGGGSYINVLDFNGVGQITTGNRSTHNGAGFYECIDDNDDCANAFVILDSPDGNALSAVGAFGTLESTDGASSCESPPKPDRWYVYSATCDSTVTVQVDNSFNFNLAVFDACGGTELDCDTGTIIPQQHKAEITWTMLAGETHLIRVSNGGLKAQYVLVVTSVPSAPANDNMASPEAMGLGETVGVELCGATNDGTSTCAPGERDVWFSYTSADCDQTIRLSSSPFVVSSFAVYNPSGQEIECQDNPWGITFLTVEFPAMTWAQPANTTYQIRASSDLADALTFAITELAITDSDGDEVCDQLDICQGDDASGDTDSDGVCDDIDPCPIDNPDDTDEDGVCDSVDNCPDDSNADQLDSDGPDPALSPVGAWHFDENTGTTTTDVVAGHVGTLNTVVWNVSGYRGSALEFPPGGSTVGVPASTDFDITDHLTIALWVKPSGFPVSVHRLVTRPNENYVLRLQGQKPHFYVKKGGVITASRASMEINAGEWTHLAAVWDGASDGLLRIYVNGSEVPDYDTQGTVSLPLDTFETGVNLGNGGGERFEGLMDELVIYDHALSDAEVMELFHLGFGDGTGDACDPCPQDNPDDTDGDGVCDSNDSCPNSPNAHNITQGTFHATIGDAISATSQGDVIELGACVFNERLITLNNHDITLRGQGPDVTIIDGQGMVGSILILTNGDESTIEGLTIRNGVADAANGGGGALIRSSVGTFRECAFENNSNNGFGFGAIAVQSGGRGEFEKCVFSGNTCDRAASVMGTTSASTLRVVNCLFFGNFGADRTIHAQGAAEIANCTFADTGDGVAMQGLGVTIDATNCVFDASSVIGPGVTPVRCLYAGATGDNIGGVPTFVDAPNGDYRLAPGSLGIDAADHDAYTGASGGATDLNGDPRTHDDLGTPDTGSGTPSYLDMGAYEFQGTTVSGECNGDGKIDLDDYDDFAACLLGPGGGLGIDCNCFDFDHDGHVTSADFAEFQVDFTGN